MSSQSFNRPGAVDLSELARNAGEAPTPGAPSTTAAGTSGQTWVTEATEENFNEFAQKSVQYPVLALFTSPRAQGADATVAALARITDEAQGRWLMVTVDVDANPRLAQTLGIQAVPMLVAIIGGQAAPLAQGTMDENQLRQIADQVAQAAVSSGMVGRAEAISKPSTTTAAEEQPKDDPRTAQAEQLIADGKFDEAVAAYDALLANQPNDAVLKAGRAGAAVLGRLAGTDPRELLQSAQAAPDDLDAQLAAADAQVLGGDVKGGFDRLVETVRRTRDEDRDRARTRLLELFDLVGPDDPNVAPARRSLAAALF